MVGDMVSGDVLNIPSVTVYRPTGLAEMELVRQSGYKRWPARLPKQPIFYAVTNEAYARQIATQWNAPGKGVGYITRFAVSKSFIDCYPIHQVGGAIHTEWRIPAEDLEEMNANIVGIIDVIGQVGDV